MKEKALHIGKKIISHELISGSSFLFIGTIFANFFAFLFNLFVVRRLSYSAYGEYAALLSLITLLTIPAQSLSPVIVRFSTKYISKREIRKAAALYKHVSRFFVAVSAVVLVAIAIGNPLIKSFFHISDTGLMLFSGIIVAITYIAIPNNVYLQSYLKFSFISVLNIVGGFAKFATGILFILLGFQVMGALGALAAATVVTYCMSFVQLKELFQVKQSGEIVPVFDIVMYAFPTMVALFALSSFISTDILLAKHFFSSQQAGLYAGLSLMGRIVFYFTAPITSVMFPLVIKRYEEKKNFKMLLYLALFLVFIPSIGITLLYFISPKIMILLFLGGKGYFAISPYLGWYGIFLCVYSILNVLVNFFLSLKRTEVVVVISLGAIAQFVGISLFHNTFTSIIYVSLLSSLGLLLLLLLYYYRLYGIKKTF